MIPTYDRKGAALELATISGKRQVNIHSGLQLSKMFEGNKSYATGQYGSIWRLVHKPNEDSADEEVVVMFQGIICQKDMPPCNDKNIPCSKAKYVRQSVALTAFGSPIFDAILTNIALIHSVFKRALGDRLMEGAVHSTYQDYPAIDAANRYFTPKGLAAPEDIRPLTGDVDPLGSLQRAAGSAYVHTEDNKVYYFEKMETGKSSSTFREAGPQIFQIGDIVEVQVSFIAVPLRDNKYRINTVLRSISLLDGQFTQEAFVKGLTLNLPIPTKERVVLKRKVGYMDEEISMARARIAEMDIDGRQGCENSRGDLD